mmetsp:Transcript_66966/g.179217  ORF Transcript_66966/g.179217 Transcript_66966/m.179217 type:complete len:453 (+) Transcript_66966:78-1436(+)
MNGLPPHRSKVEDGPLHSAQHLLAVAALLHANAKHTAERTLRHRVHLQRRLGLELRGDGLPGCDHPDHRLRNREGRSDVRIHLYTERDEARQGDGRCGCHGQQRALLLGLVRERIRQREGAEAPRCGALGLRQRRLCQAERHRHREGTRRDGGRDAPGEGPPGRQVGARQRQQAEEHRQGARGLRRPPGAPEVFHRCLALRAGGSLRGAHLPQLLGRQLGRAPGPHEHTLQGAGAPHGRAHARRRQQHLPARLHHVPSSRIGRDEWPWRLRDHRHHGRGRGEACRRQDAGAEEAGDRHHLLHRGLHHADLRRPDLRGGSPRPRLRLGADDEERESCAQHGQSHLRGERREREGRGARQAGAEGHGPQRPEPGRLAGAHGQLDLVELCLDAVDSDSRWARAVLARGLHVRLDEPGNQCRRPAGQPQPLKPHPQVAQRGGGGQRPLGRLHRLPR